MILRSFDLSLSWSRPLHKVIQNTDGGKLLISRKISLIHYHRYICTDAHTEMEFLDMESFAPCYSQFLLLADFIENHTLLWL
jgi:hypothetical protein